VVQPETAVSGLAKIIAQLLHPKGTKRVFTREDGVQNHVSTIDQILKSAAKRAGISREKRSWKALRHTFASHQITYCKTDLYTLMHLMGHVKITTTQRYAFLIEDIAQRKAMKEMAGVTNFRETKAQREERLANESGKKVANIAERRTKTDE